jgi:hypothetical protein
MMPLPPPLFSWATRAVQAGNLPFARALLLQEFWSARAVRDAAPEPCLLSATHLLEIPDISAELVAELEERYRNGTSVDLDHNAQLGDAIWAPNSAKLYLDLLLSRQLFAKQRAKGRIIPWPREAPGPPHFVSAASISFKFESGEQKRDFGRVAASRHVTAQRAARDDMLGCQSRLGAPLVAPCMGPLPCREARLYHDTSHPVGNLNTRGEMDPSRRLVYSGLNSFLRALRPGDALFKTDLSGAFPSLKNRLSELYVQGLAFDGTIYLEFAMSLGTRTGPDNYDTCLGSPLQALIVERFRRLDLEASLSRWVDDFLGRVSVARHGADLVLAARQAFIVVETAAADLRAALAPEKTTLPWIAEADGTLEPNYVLRDALGFDIESHPAVVLIIPAVKLADICFEADRARRASSIAVKDLESLYGKIAGIAAALEGALPFASDLLLLLVQTNRRGLERAVIPPSLTEDLGFFADLAHALARRICVPNTIDVPEGHVEKDAATGTASEPGFLSVHLCGHVLVFEPPAASRGLRIATLELLAAAISSFCCAALWPNMQVATTDDNSNCISWLESGHAGDEERNFMLRQRARALMVANMREHHSPIASERNVLADAGTHLNEAKRQIGFAAYLRFLSDAYSRAPSWWPAGFPFPPRARSFDRIDGGSTIGILAARVSRSDCGDLCYTREEVGRLLPQIRLQLLGAANADPI